MNLKNPNILIIANMAAVFHPDQDEEHNYRCPMCNTVFISKNPQCPTCGNIATRYIGYTLPKSENKGSIAPLMRA